MPVFPQAILIRDLEFYNSEYNEKTIKRHDALYRGGEHFKKLAKEFLSMREIEKVRPELYQQRIDRTAYVPHSAVIDYMVSAVMRKEPVVSGPSDYWDKLNSDADGDGTDLPMVARRLLLDALLHGRSWLEVYFGEDYIPDNDTDIDGENTQDAKLQVVPPSMVDDWGSGFARIHTKQDERSADMMWGPTTRTVERWSFLTDTQVAKYQYVRETNPLKNSSQQHAADLVSLENHDLGICPLIKLEISHPGMWVMNRIDQMLVQLYNRESALQFALDQGCFSLLVLTLNTTDIKTIYASEVAALKLSIGEDAKYISPPTSIYDAAMKDLDRSRTELARSIHGLSLEAASKTQAPRATLGATKLQQGPSDALLASYAAPVKDVLIKAFTAIAEMRGEDPSKVKLEGMDDFLMDDEVEDEVSSSEEESDDTSVDNSGSSEKEK